MTESEFRKRVKSLPDATRAKIVNHLSEAYMEISAAEYLLILEGWRYDINVPVIDKNGSLNQTVRIMWKLFDFENFHD
jgi:hypothetical protein